MSITKRGNTWFYRFSVNNREYYKTTGLDAVPQNLSEARRIEAQAKLTALAGVEVTVTSDVPFDAAADQFLGWCFSTEYRSKPNTARRIQISFQSLLVFFAGRSVEMVTQNAVEDYKTWRLEVHGVRDVTLRHDLHALSVFFRKYAIRKGWADSNPVDLVTIPSDKDAVRIHFVTPDEEAAYFARARGTLYDVTRLMLLQGCRPEEILALRPEHVDLRTETLRIAGGKTRAARRDLPLTSESVVILQKRLEQTKGSRWLFPSRRKAGAHITRLNSQHDTVCLDAELSFVPYDFRHTWATRALTEAKMDVGTVAALMGHASPYIVLKHYVHPTAEGKRSAMKDYEAAMRPKLRRVK